MLRQRQLVVPEAAPFVFDQVDWQLLLLWQHWLIVPLQYHEASELQQQPVVQQQWQQPEQQPDQQQFVVQQQPVVD